MIYRANLTYAHRFTPKAARIHKIFIVAASLLLLAGFARADVASLEDHLDPYFNDPTILFQVTGDEIDLSEYWNNVNDILTNYNLEVELKNQVFQTAGEETLSELDANTFESFMALLQSSHDNIYEIVHGDQLIINSPLPDVGPLPDNENNHGGTTIPEPSSFILCAIAFGMIARKRNFQQSNPLG